MFHTLLKQNKTTIFGIQLCDPVYGVHKVGRCRSQCFGIYPQEKKFGFKFIMGLFIRCCVFLARSGNTNESVQIVHFSDQIQNSKIIAS